MGRASKKTKETIEQPETHYHTPSDIVEDNNLSHEEKRQALNTWEQNARQLLTASNEGMPGSKEGVEKDDHHRLAEVVRAKGKIGERPTHKPAH